MNRNGQGSGRPEGAPDATTMLSDALARMPYGVSAWSEDHRLLLLERRLSPPLRHSRQEPLSRHDDPASGWSCPSPAATTPA